MRNYIVATWSDADQYDYSGEQIGNRQGKSHRVHFNPDGSACVASYGDPKPAKKVAPLVDRILPQLRTLNKRLEEIRELEAEYKAGLHSPEDYTLLRDVAFKKKDRAERLYYLAIGKPQSRSNPPVANEESDTQTDDSCQDTRQDRSSPSIVTDTWIDSISDDNSLKFPLQKALQISRKLVQWTHKAKAYWNELKEV